MNFEFDWNRFNFQQNASYIDRYASLFGELSLSSWHRDTLAESTKAIITLEMKRNYDRLKPNIPEIEFLIKKLSTRRESGYNLNFHLKTAKEFIRLYEERQRTK